MKAARPLGRRILPVALTAGAVTLAGCGGTVELKSAWCDREVRIDGENTEWSGAITDFPEQKITVGLMNDGEFLYLGLFVGDERTRTKATMTGITLWFDSEGAKERRFGIHYPLDPRPRERWQDGPGKRGERESPELRRADGASVGGEVEILGPKEGERMRTRLTKADGLEIAVRPHDTSLVYELKIPLAVTDEHAFAVGAEPGRQIGVGVVIGGMDGGPRGGPDGGGPDGGAPPRGGMGPGGVGGMGGVGGIGPGEEGRPRGPQPLEIWAKVELVGAAEESAVRP